MVRRAILQALLVPIGDHEHAASLPTMLRTARRMAKTEPGSAERASRIRRFPTGTA